MRIILFFFLLLVIPGPAFGIDKAEFSSLMDKINSKDFPPVESFLAANKEKLSADPEYYVLLLNYVGNKGIRSNLVVAKGEPQKGDFPLSSADTGKVVGFIGDRPQIDEKLIIDGIKQTQNALKHFQNRLDIHFVIVAVAERIGRWDIVGDQIISMLIISKQNNNAWIWGPVSSMSGDPKEFMIENILPRTASMFEANTDLGYQAFLKVSQQLIDSYPDLIYGYANLGVLYLSKKNYDLAKTYLLKAQKIDPSDKIVQGNLKILKREHH